MKRCPTCNRSYSDESLMFCADDGTQLVSETATSEPSPASMPTMAAPPPYTPPPQPSYQTAPKRKKWLALIALALGVISLPFLLYSLSQPILREFAFRNASVNLLLFNLWGGVTLFGGLLVLLSVIVALVAIIVSIKKPAQYGGRALALVGPVLGILLLVLVVGAFALRRIQGPTFPSYYSANSNRNSNYNSNRSSNYNSSSDSNSDSNSNSSDSSTESDSTSMSETEKYRLFYAAAKSGDTSLQQRAAKKVGIVDANGSPSSTYQSFTKGMLNWAFRDSAWVKTIDTPAKARAYAEERMGSQ